MKRGDYENKNTLQGTEQNDELKLNDAELRSVLNLESLNEKDIGDLRELIYSLSMVLYKSFKHEES